MIFRQLYDPTSSTYTYLLADEASNEAILIDPVFEQYDRDAALIRELGYTLVAVLETHIHADHITGAWLLREAFGCQICVSKAGGAEGVDRELVHGDIIKFGGFEVEARATPGHTNGCTTFVCHSEKLVFTGDTMLIRGAGRTDFQQGNAHTLFESITEQIFSLGDDFTVYPGHDYSGRTSSSVGEEKKHNPRVGGGASATDFAGYMNNLHLPHPKQIDRAVPGNLKVGKPDTPPLPYADWAPVRRTYAGLLEVDPEWVAEHRDEVHLIDVRDNNEIATEMGMIAGSEIVPIDKLKERVASLPTDKPIVAVCRSGKRSGQATVIMRKAGIKDCANMAGGMLRWVEAGYPADMLVA